MCYIGMCRGIGWYGVLGARALNRLFVLVVLSFQGVSLNCIT